MSKSMGVEPLSVSSSLQEQESMGVGPVRARVVPEVGEITQLRLGNRPKVELPKNCDQPVSVIGGGSSVAAATEAYKSLRNRLMNLQANRGIRSVAVTSAAQSDGKTLTTFNLACCVAQLNDASVLLVDADLRTRALTKLIGRMPAVGLANVLTGTASYAEAMVRTDMPNLCVVGAGTSDESPAELFATDRWKQFMRWASESFKLVLVDSLPVGIVVDFDVTAAECDGVLVVVRALKTPREALQEALDHLDPKKMLGVVWNGDVERPSKGHPYS